ncbi:metal-dependent hydrolase [Aquimarina sp. AD10]|uniref:metal-dependent hydrolase n=1 Tax=Aquimarina sp. AD10 TaxID=1714849 RepID=UPI000E50B401|nr:metal-dependent hydrolase [Aquimarina sp. AD10]AXT58927.1 metal-dependent hydrolase [Aquimarina sp. AD10]RKM99597.1 metal-dependent hydrolase [Aquimarina sp. AD10]
MDSLTQIVLGAAIAEATLGKKVGNKAILWGAIAGTIPDLDVLSKFFVDNVTANEVHRGFSHSIVFSLLAAPLFGWLISKIYKNKEANWKDWTKLMFLGLFTHPLLDAFTTWGTQLFWPFAYKVSFKNIFVVDPLYTIPFLVFLILAMRYKRSDPKRRKFNVIGLYMSSIYMLVTLGLKWNTYYKFQASLKNQNIEYKEIQTKPTPLNSILWTANIETKDSFLIGYYSLLDKDDNITFSEFPKNHHLLGKMKNDPLLPRLINLSEGWYTIEKKDNKVYFNDLRFGQLGMGDTAKRFVFSYELFYDQEGILQAKERGRNTDEASPLLKKLFARMLGNKS